MAQRLRDEHGNPIELTDEHSNPIRLTDEHGRPMHLSGVATTHAPSSDVGTGAGYTGLASGHESGLAGHDKIHGDTGATDGGIYGGVLTSTTKLGVGTGTGTGTGLLHPEQPHQMGGLTTQAPGDRVGTGTGYSGLAPGHESGQHGQVHGGTAAMAAGGMAGHGVGTGQHHERLGEQLRHTGGERGELRRSSSSSSSSSEDDGQGGRRKKKGLTTKIKEKLTGKNKDEHAQGTAVTSGTTTTTTTTGQAGQLHPEHEKKSMMEKIKEKLPGHHTTHP